MSEGSLIIIFAVLGVCLGSFVNAAVWRIKVKKDIVHDRSECVHCHHKLVAGDLVPIFSWIALGGKCRYCRKPISVQYPIVELAVMAYFVLSYLLWPIALDTTYAWIDFGLWLSYGVGLAILFVYDLKWYLLPDKVVWPLVALGMVNFVNTGLWHQWSLGQFFAEFILAVGVIAGVYYVLYFISKGKWVGFGDVKLGLFMGLALGWQAGLVALLLANVIGCLIVIPGLALGKLKRDSRIPFGPLLIAGFVLAGIWGHQLFDWYIGGFGL
mgnify:CR=1 FL=1